MGQREEPTMFTKKFDPYLVIARQSKFIDHFVKPEESDVLLDLIVEVTAPSSGKLLQQEYAAQTSSVIVTQAHVEARSRFVTIRAPDTALDGLAKLKYVKRISLAQAIRHQRPEPRFKTLGQPVVLPSVGHAEKKSIAAADRVLAAVIDHGCPFAHKQFRHADGYTRVVVLWDQDKSPNGAFQQSDPPSGFGYGHEVRKSKLDQYIASARSDDGSFDESRCYRNAGYDAMDADLTHGSHVLGRFVGPSYSLRSQTSEDNTGTVDDIIARTADIAFVQFPRDVLETPSLAMDRCIIDGLRYLRKFAESEGYSRCVVVCSYGSYLGPHDGTSIFERAVDAFLDENKRSKKSVTRFDLVLPAGNCADKSLHAVMTTKANRAARLQWILPADNEAPTYAEIWAGKDAAELKVQIEVSGKQVEIGKAGNAALPDGLSAICQVQSDDQTVYVLRAGPTKVSDDNTPQAVSGRLSITVQCKNAGVKVHAYSCWGGTNIGFASRTWEAPWSVRADDTKSWKISERGTILGSGCGASMHLHVIGGYADDRDPKRRQRAPYSSIGPSRGSREGPDFLAMADGMSANSGILGPGTRSGFEFRMSGTSVAAPQAARAILNEKSNLPLPKSRLTLNGITKQKGGRGFLNCDSDQ